MGIFSKTAARAAALAKYYFPFKWYNLPSIESPINAAHLNHIEDGVNEMDNRILILHQDKADRAEIANVFMDFTMDDKTGVMTFTRFDGTTVTHDSAVEKIALNCYLEGDNFVLELADGTKQKVSLAKFIDTYTFSSTDTIRMTVNGKNIAADIPDGKITLAKLEPTVMSTIRQYMLDAQTAKGVAEQAASTAQGWAIGGTGFEGINAKEYAEKAKRYAVGGVEEGDTTDNAEYYCVKAAQSAEEAKQAAGCDGTATSILAEDSQGLVGAAGGTSDVQALIDTISAKVVNDLVSNTTLTERLAGYLLKSQVVNNLLATVPGNVLDATQGKALKDLIDVQNNNLKWKNVADIPLDSLAYRSNIDRINLYHGVRISGVDNLDGDNDLWILVFLRTADGSSARFIVLDVRENTIKFITKLNGTFSVWKSL